MTSLLLAGSLPHNFERVSSKLEGKESVRVKTIRTLEAARKELGKEPDKYDLIVLNLHDRQNHTNLTDSSTIAKFSAISKRSRIIAVISTCTIPPEEALKAGADYFIDKDQHSQELLRIYISKLLKTKSTIRREHSRQARNTHNGDTRSFSRETKTLLAVLEVLKKAFRKITSRRNQTNAIEKILESTIDTFEAKTGRIYHYHRNTKDIELIAGTKHESRADERLAFEREMAERFLRDGAPHVIINKGSDKEHEGHRYEDDAYLEAILGVPIIWKDVLLGCLYISDRSTRTFKTDEARILESVAQQLAIVMKVTGLLDSHRKASRRLQEIAQATKEIMADLTGMELGQRLSLIAHRVAQIVEAESCGVFLAPSSEKLTLEASWGHRPGHFTKGTEFEIHNREKAGLTGWIAFHGSIFNSSGRDLRNHVAVRKGGQSHTRSGTCYSLLALPLRKPTGVAESTGDKLVGLLRVDNKLDHKSQPDGKLAFTDEDQKVLSIFSDLVTVALENAKLVNKLKEEEEKKSKLIESSPNGIIAVNNKGEVTEFNTVAEKVLEITKPEVIGVNVEKLYTDPGEPRKIGKRLHQGSGSVRGHLSSVRQADGRAIPIRISATWIFDSKKRRIGSAGYFEDLRELRQLEDTQALLLKASNILAEEGRLTSGLQEIARLLIEFLQDTYARILIFNEAGTALTVEAAYIDPSLACRWEPGRGQKISLAHLEDARTAIEIRNPVTLKFDNPNCDTRLRVTQKQLGLSCTIYDLLVVPLIAGESAVGILEIGSLRPADPSRPSLDVEALAKSVASQTAAMIDRIKMHRVTKQQKGELETLQEAVEIIAQEIESEKVLLAVSRSSAKHLKADLALAWSVDLRQNAISGYGIAGTKLSSIEEQALREEELKEGRTIDITFKNGWLSIPDIEKAEPGRLAPGTKAILLDHRIKRLQSMLLQHRKDPIGILYLGYSTTEPVNWSPPGLLARFSFFAALALRNALLHQQVSRAHAVAKESSLVLAQEKASSFMNRIPQVIRAGLHCHSVILFILDAKSYRIKNEPISDGMTSSQFVDNLSELAGTDLFRNIAESGEVLLVDDLSITKYAKEASIFRDEGLRSVAALGMRLEDSSEVAVLFAAHNTSHHFSDADLEIISGCSNFVTIALRSTQFREEALATRTTIETLYDASEHIGSSLDLEETKSEVQRQILRLLSPQVRADATSHIRLFRSQYALPLPEQFTPGNETTHPPDLGDKATRSSQNKENHLYLPLVAHGQVLGEITVESPVEAEFDTQTVRNLESLCLHASAAIRNAQLHAAAKRDLEDLRILHESAKQMARANDLASLHTLIARCGRELFQASAAILWPYDSGSQEFISELAASDGIPANQFKKLKRIRARRTGTRHLTLRNRHLEVQNLDKEKPSHLNKAASEFLNRNRILSYQGTAMVVGTEEVGVLFIDYELPNQVNDRKRRLLRNFATYAALAIKNLRLTQNQVRMQQISQLVGNVTVNMSDSSILAILKSAPAMVDCSVAKLFVRDPINREEVCFSVEPSTPPSRLKKTKTDDGTPLKRALKRSDILYSDANRPLDLKINFLRKHDIKSWILIRMRTGERDSGVFFVGSKRRRNFMHDDLLSVQLVANQTAIALAKDYLFQKSKSRADALNALFNAGKRIAESLSVEETLNTVAQEAQRILGDEHTNAETFTYVALMRKHRHFEVVATYPEAHHAKVQRAVDKVNSRKTRLRRGITTIAVERAKSFRVKDVRQSKYYISIDPTTRSQLAVPILFRDRDDGNKERAIGVISIECNRLDAFSEEDMNTAKLLATQASVAIQNARSYTEIKKTKGLIGARTALAWTGMLASQWRHDIESDAVTIRDEAEMLLDQGRTQRETSETEQGLKKIERLATRIFSRPILPPLESEEGRTKFSINDAVREWRLDFLKRDAYDRITPKLDLGLKDGDFVLGSAAWLSKAFEHLIDNAARAASGSLVPRIVISTYQSRDRCCIAIRDNGHGIPSAVKEGLFQRPIKNARDAGGLGVGLLLAQAIVQSDDGDISCLDSDSNGTTMEMWLPREVSPNTR